MDRTLYAILITACILIDLTMYLVTLRAATGRLARNWWAGIRTTATRHSDEAWIAAHVAAYPIMRDTAIANAVLVIISLFLPGDFQSYALQISLGVLVIGVILGLVQAQKAAKDVIKTEQNPERQ